MLIMAMVAEGYVLHCTSKFFRWLLLLLLLLLAMVIMAMVFEKYVLHFTSKYIVNHCTAACFMTPSRYFLLQRRREVLFECLRKLVALTEMQQGLDQM